MYTWRQKYFCCFGFSSPSSCYVKENTWVHWILSSPADVSDDLLPCLMSAWGSDTWVQICVVFSAHSANILCEAKVWRLESNNDTWYQHNLQSNEAGHKVGTELRHISLYTSLLIFFSKRLPRVWLRVLHLCYLLLGRSHWRDGVEGLQNTVGTFENKNLAPVFIVPGWLQKLWDVRLVHIYLRLECRFSPGSVCTLAEGEGSEEIRLSSLWKAH